MSNQNLSNDSSVCNDKTFVTNNDNEVHLHQNSRHILFKGNPRVIVASREAIGAMKYKSE